MQFKVKLFGEPKSKWAATIRSGLVSIVFLTGIICVLASGAPNSLIPPDKIQDEQLVQVHERVAELEKEIADTSRQIAEEDDPESKAALVKVLTKRQEQLEYNQNYLESVKNARETGTCFTSDMKVLTEDGAKPIGEIKVGDKVLSVDADGRQVAADVLKTLADRNRHYYLINGSIKVTGLHRFFTETGWKKAKELVKGDRIQTTTGVFEKIAAIEWVPADDLRVYNLTIAENHNFFISPDGKHGYLVHNSGGGGGGGSK